MVAKQTVLIIEEKARSIYLGMLRDFTAKLDNDLKKLWWLLDVSEKNIWLDDTIHRIFSSLNGNIPKLPPSDTRYGVSAIKATLKTCFKLFMTTLYGIKNPQIKKGSLGFFSLYPFWWKDPTLENAQDLFFKQIPKEMAKKHKVYQLIWLLEEEKLFLDRKKGRAVKKWCDKNNAVIVEKYLSAGDIFSLFSPELRRKISSMRDFAGKYTYVAEGIDFAPFLRHELMRSLSSPRFLQWWLMDKAMSKIPLQNLSKLFFRLEFQPLERALLYNTKDKTCTIGFQHSSLSRNFLNYVFPDGYFTESSSGMPLPDRIITSGQKGYDYMLKAGFPAERLAIGGGIRYLPLFEYKKNLPAKQVIREKNGLPTDKKIILSATSPLITESLCMLEQLFSSLKAHKDDYYVIVKIHPNVVGYREYESQIADFFAKLGSEVQYRLIADFSSPYEYIALSDAIYLTGGSVALEAMVLGVIPVKYRCRQQFSHDPLEDYQGAYIDADQKDMLEILLDENKVREIKKNWDIPFRDMFGEGEPSKEAFLCLVEDMQ
ncbi:MAG: hypothetical protein ABIB65_06010 [Candidatus Margulisiibacteriota bacterium]